MCISLSWDGTTTRGMSTTPICTGVANANTMKSTSQFCLGYMPVLPAMGKQFYASPKATEVKFFIRNAAITAILQELEIAAKHGVVCRLYNCHGVDSKRLLMPRLVSINLDQPEAQLFYGLLNKSCCTKCKRRKGYSAFRQTSSPTRTVVKRLYDIVSAGNKQVENKKVKKLNTKLAKVCYSV